MFRVIKDEFGDRKIFKILFKILASIPGYVTRKQINHSSVLEPELTVFDFNGYESFYGYYDRSPFSADMKYLLFYRSKHSTKLNPNPDKHIELLLYDYNNKCIVKIWNILAYNWQQGSKVQWLDNNNFIFNNYDKSEKKYYSTIVNKITLTEKTFRYPFYESCCNFFLSLNFDRLNKYRPDYGYRNNGNKELLNDEADGIFIFNFSELKFELLISIDELKSINPIINMIGARHKVNHIMLSPDKQKFIFMHRWILKSGSKIDRLYLYDFKSKSLTCLADTGMVSHCFWKDKNTVIAYMNGVNSQPGYNIINLGENSIQRMPECIQCFGDGHPHILNNNMIFDTYPDKERNKHLYKYNLETNTLAELGSFYEPLGFECQCRCDLHPRYCSESIISIDSTHTGKRCFVLVKADKIIP